jgi:hypothetical protein
LPTPADENAVAARAPNNTTTSAAVVNNSTITARFGFVAFGPRLLLSPGRLPAISIDPYAVSPEDHEQAAGRGNARQYVNQLSIVHQHRLMKRHGMLVMKLVMLMGPLHSPVACAPESWSATSVYLITKDSPGEHPDKNRA